jgi:hypothetical protein
MNATAERAARQSEGGAALRLRFGREQIRQSFRFGQIHPPVLECAAGKFSGLRAPQSFDSSERIENAGDDGSAAVKVKLGHVLARRAPGAGEGEANSPIQYLASGGMTDHPKGRLSRLRK